jgi:uracil-DNA glycosylase
MELNLEKSFPENLPPVWKSLLSREMNEAYFQKLTEFLAREYRSEKLIHPQPQWILRALQLVDYEKVKVVILGQDPYHGEGQAIGLSFGVANELFPKPPSLMNIFKELKSDLGIEIQKNHTDLTGWAEQGVLLLNTVLTVRNGEAFSHRDAGWEFFTDRVIARLNERGTPLVFILWGAAAQKKKSLITSPHHFVLESAHPSPLSASRGFFGSRPFSKTNEILVDQLKQSPIDWSKLCSR